jgi:hypothetical protein
MAFRLQPVEGEMRGLRPEQAHHMGDLASIDQARDGVKWAYDDHAPF